MVSSSDDSPRPLHAPRHHTPDAPPAATRLLRALSFRRPPSSRRGEALWEREAAGSGSLEAASSESAAGAFGSGAAAVESAADSVVALSCGWVWMVVRFVCVIRVPVCPCVPCVSRLPPVSFYRYSSVRRDPIEAYTADTSEQQLQYHA